MRKVLISLIVLFSIIAVGISFVLGIFTATTSNLAETTGAASVTEALSGNVIPEPTPLPTLSPRTRWYLSGDVVQSIGCRVMYSEPKNGSYIFVPYCGEIIWIAYNSSGQYPAGEWTGHIKKMGYECIVSIGVFDNRTKEFYVCGSATITEPEQNFTIRTWTFSVGEDQYLAFRVYNPSCWVKVVTCDGACYIDKWLCDSDNTRIDDDGGYTGVYEVEVERLGGEVVFVRARR